MCVCVMWLYQEGMFGVLEVCAEGSLVAIHCL